MAFANDRDKTTRADSNRDKTAARNINSFQGRFLTGQCAKDAGCEDRELLGGQVHP